MRFPAEVHVHAIKESSGSFEGRAFSSCVFHCEVELKENNVGRAIGRVTRPFKLGDHTEFDKWAHFGPVLKQGPIKAMAEFEIEATKDDTRMTLVSIRPLEAKPVQPAPRV